MNKLNLYHVIIFNDDSTPMLFVEKIIEKVFKKSENESKEIAFRIHSEGSQIIGTYIKEIAETKQAQTNFNSKNHNFSLICSLEKKN